MTASAQATFALRSHNPDVLTCIANLSNDEVFTPPEFANQMLDTLEVAWAEANDGASIWSDSTVTFLDPFTKSGVFLREIVSRLNAGLEAEIPDLEDRVDHILTKQVFGIGITRLTSLLARRSVYCSKDATGEHSIAKSFDRDWGNIWFERTEHTWAGEKCAYCGASKAGYSRNEDLETHAYAFIHTTDIKAHLTRMFGADVQFDVIIGNPPYQLSDGGFGTSAAPIYHRFIDQAKKLSPRFLTMVVPARWYSGGKGLDEFRADMLADRELVELHDFPDSRDCFPDVDIAGGICFFLWQRGADRDCRVVSHQGHRRITAIRPLLEPGSDIFIRHNDAIQILRKVSAVESPNGKDGPVIGLPVSQQFATSVSARKPFGLGTNYLGRAERTATHNLQLLRSRGTGWVAANELSAGGDLVEKWKVLTSKASHDHAGQPDKAGTRRVLSRTEVAPPGTVVTESYILLGVFEQEQAAWNCLSYATTRFFRFLVSLRSSTQDITKSRFAFVPLQDFSRSWTDADLYAKYGLADHEVAFIESMIRPMGARDA